jgi:hypothetical protein
VDDALNRLIGGACRREQDDRQDGERGEIPGSTIPIGQLTGCRPAPQQERGRERHCGPGVTNVVHCVRKQSDRAGEHHDQHLQGSRDSKNDQRPPEGAQCVIAAENRRIDAGVAVAPRSVIMSVVVVMITIRAPIAVCVTLVEIAVVVPVIAAMNRATHELAAPVAWTWSPRRRCSTWPIAWSRSSPTCSSWSA